jgi:hypothetical protein
MEKGTDRNSERTSLVELALLSAARASGSSRIPLMTAQDSAHAVAIVLEHLGNPVDVTGRGFDVTNCCMSR